MPARHLRTLRSTSSTRVPGWSRLCSNTPGPRCPHCPCMSTTPWCGRCCVQIHRAVAAPVSVPISTTPWVDSVYVQTCQGLGAPTQHSFRVFVHEHNTSPWWTRLCSNTPGTQCSHSPCMSTTPWVDEVVFKHARDSVLAQIVHKHNTLGGQGCVQTHQGLSARTVRA